MCFVGMSLFYYISVLVRFILEKLFDAVHMKEFMSVVTIDVA